MIILLGDQGTGQKTAPYIKCIFCDECACWCHGSVAANWKFYMDIKTPATAPCVKRLLKALSAGTQTWDILHWYKDFLVQKAWILKKTTYAERLQHVTSLRTRARENLLLKNGRRKSGTGRRSRGRFKTTCSTCPMSLTNCEKSHNKPNVGKASVLPFKEQTSLFTPMWKENGLGIKGNDAISFPLN